MCRKVLALYDLCYDAESRPSTCNPSRPVNSPKNDVYFGLQRCSKEERCPEDGCFQTVYLPLVARTCSDTCEQDLNLDYWHERRRTRRKEYNPFLDRMLCLGRDSRLYHVVTGECVAKEEQFGDDPPVEMAVHQGMLPAVPWEQAVASGVGHSEGQSSRSGTGGDTEVVGESMVRFGDLDLSTGEESSSTQASRTSTFLDYRSHLRALRERTSRFEPRRVQDRPSEPLEERTSGPSWLGRRLIRSKRSKQCIAGREQP